MGDIEIASSKNSVTVAPQNSITIEKIDIYTEYWWLYPAQVDRELKEV